MACSTLRSSDSSPFLTFKPQFQRRSHTKKQEQFSLEEHSKEERKYRCAITSETLIYIQENFEFKGKKCFDEAFMDTPDFNLMSEGSFLKLIEFEDGTTKWNLKLKVKECFMGKATFLQYSVVNETSEIVSELQTRKKFSRLPWVKKVSNQPIDYCEPFATMRVVRYTFGTSEAPEIELLVDLSLLAHETYHLVATLRTPEKPSRATKNFIKKLQTEDAFAHHPVEGRIYAWLRKFKPDKLPALPQVNYEEDTLFKECPFNRDDVQMGPFQTEREHLL